MPMYAEPSYISAVTAATKDDRLALRLTQQQKQEIERAAAITGRSVTDFSVSALVREAADVIAHERDLVMSHEGWEAFNAAITQPAYSIEGFARLLTRPSVFVD